jgi:hypothetical protein
LDGIIIFGGSFNKSTDLYEYGLSNIGVLSFYNDSNQRSDLGVSTSGNMLTFNDNTIITEANLDNSVSDLGYYKNNGGANLDLGNYNIVRVQNIEFGVDNGNALAINDDNIEYNGSIMMTAANVNDYVTGGGSGGWVNTATSSLSMANYQINNISELDFGPGKVVTPDSANNLTYNNEMVVVRPKLQPTYDLADGATISMGKIRLHFPQLQFQTAILIFQDHFNWF